MDSRTLIELLQIFIDNIVPILAVAGTGFIVGRQLNMDGKLLGQLIFNLFSPALAFQLLYTSEVEPSELILLFIGTVVFQLLMFGLTWGMLRWRRVSRVDTAAVVISAFSLNAGNYGLSLVSFAYGTEVLARAVIVFVSNLVLNFSLGVLVASSGRNSLRASLRGLLKVPTIYAIPAALILRGIDLDLPLAVVRPIELLAQATIPCMLVMLGLQLSQSVRPEKLRLVSTGVALKMLVAPLIGFALALLLNLNGLARAAFITQVSMPTAVMTLVLSTEYELDTNLSLNLIMISTLVSPITLSLLIYLLRPGIGLMG